MRLASASATALLSCALVAGCAGLLPASFDAARAPDFRQTGLSVSAAAESIAVGSSTKAQVAALLGEAESVRFVTGYEVWVYRARSTRAPGQVPELAILFSPEGVVKKVRARPASTAG